MYYIGLEREKKNYKGDKVGYSDLEHPEGLNEPGGIVQKEDDRGPYHTILKLGYHKLISEVLETDNDAVFEVFVNELLPIAVGKLKWNALTKKNKLSDFVHKSNKAFAMVVIENGAPRWLDIVKYPNKEVKYREKTLYTLGNEARGTAGWSAKGIKRFAGLCKIVSDRYAREDGAVYKRKCDEIVKKKCYTNKRLKMREKEAMNRFGLQHGLGNEAEEEEEINKQLKDDLMMVMNDNYLNFESV